LIDVSRNERQPGCTFACKTQRHFAAKTLRGTGNENVLTCEFSHSRNLRPVLQFATLQSTGSAAVSFSASKKYWGIVADNLSKAG
jgi:hypothetical protein